MVSQRPQPADDVFDFMLLEQADAGNASRSRFQARRGVLYRDPAEGDDGDPCLAGFTQGGDAGGLRSGSTALSEDRGKDSEVGAFGLGTHHILFRVAGRSHEKVVGGQWPVAKNPYHLAYFIRTDVVRAQMNAVGSRG
jgi:hypothetical protein